MAALLKDVNRWPDADRDALRRDVQRLIVRYYGSSLQSVPIARFLGDLMTVAFKHRVRPEPDNVFREGKLDEVGLQTGMQILLTTDIRERIKRINQPVILLHGENDAIAHPNAARWLHENLQNSELVMLPHCGHAPFLSHTDQFIANIFRVAHR